jgi:DMSO/TMAO reductase YedYZ molybdopterin-dependent catalytic subunit
MNPVRLDPQGPFMRDPLAPHQMRDRLTRTQDLFILCHLGVPRIERDRWSLTIDGMVERPSTLRFNDLVRYPKTEVATIHQCCGSPLKPFEPRRRVCNVRWSGVRLVDVLADCRARSAAQYIWSYGADSGEFSGVVVPRGREWRRFSMPWTPRQRGAVVLAARAEGMGGLVQPISGRRNAIHEVAVNVI